MRGKEGDRKRELIAYTMQVGAHMPQLKHGDDLDVIVNVAVTKTIDDVFAYLDGFLIERLSKEDLKIYHGFRKHYVMYEPGARKP